MYKRHRFPPEIIQYAVWLYHRFNLSHRDIEDLMSQRGIEVSYEAIRLWCNKFGAKYAQRLRRKPKAMAILSSLMRCSLRSRGSSTICGVLWIRMVRLLMYSCRNDEMERLQRLL
jgi:transposase-like protein